MLNLLKKHIGVIAQVHITPTLNIMYYLKFTAL